MSWVKSVTIDLATWLIQLLTITSDEPSRSGIGYCMSRGKSSVVVGRVDEQRGEGAEEREQDVHGCVLCRYADVVTRQRRAARSADGEVAQR